jgi:TfoX/Sxy family transcriptional regulator of competence genes
MAYEEAFAARIRAALAGRKGLSEQRMFSGIGFMIGGHMAVGIASNELLVRLPPEETDAALKEPGAHAFVMRGQAMKGWLRVGAAGTKDARSLGKWVKRGADYASSLPPKPAKAGAKTKPAKPAAAKTARPAATTKKKSRP